MKRINFIAPVESMRGNLSGAQNLEYAENNNPAFAAPNGKQYARNYVTRYIGARRAKDGRAYFAVKRSAAVNVSTMAKNRWALLGGTQSVYAALINDGQIYASMDSVYRWLVSQTGLTKTFAQWAKDIVRDALRLKKRTFDFLAGTGSSPIKVYNPWVYGETVSGALTITIKESILEKFWYQLANGPVEFVVHNTENINFPEYIKGLTHIGETWAEFIASQRNTFGWVVVGQKIRPTSGAAEYVVYDEDGDTITAGPNNYPNQPEESNQRLDYDE